MTRPLTLRRLGETEYALLDPRFVRELRYGTLYSHPDFPDRYDANQLCRASCGPGESGAMVAELGRALAGSGLGYRKVSGYDPAVWDHLGAALANEGWSVRTTSMMQDLELPASAMS